MSDALRRPWLWRTLLAGGALFLLAVGWQAWRAEDIGAKGRRDLVAVLAEIEAGDPRWRWDDLEADRPDFPEAQNSCAVLAKIGRQVRARKPMLPSSLGPAFPEERPPDNPEPAANRLPGHAEMDARLADAADHAETYALARSLRDFPHGRRRLALSLDPLSDNLDHVSRCREAEEILAYDLECRLHAGRTHDTIQDLHAILHGWAALRDEPGGQQVFRLCGQARAVRYVERLLGMSEPGESDLAGLQAHLEAEAAEPILRTALRGVRARIHQLYENLHAGKQPLGEYIEWSRSGWFTTHRSPTLAQTYTTGVLYHSYLAEDHAAYLRHMTDALAIARLPLVEQYPAWVSLDARERARWLGPLREADRFLVARLFCNGPRLGKVAVQAQAWLACGRVALAAERFRRATRRWPAHLEELVPRYLSAVPRDPFTGRPLLLKTAAEGPTVYSTGADGIDNDGAILAPRDPNAPAPDLGIRLWNPEYRRLPPGGSSAINDGPPAIPEPIR